ncbi:DUF2339 domain-containing protein [Nocardia yamanashiensis]|uniref:DUF2339 domain-containing protein n=1 Tax=Nocardia yamanashiensis TaxID=209247 RepID=UPI000AC38E9F|nr:DUF2339 domain-containing protein [Nocardia yamanashiensis]
MNTALDPRLIARLSTEFTSLSHTMSVLGRDLDVLRDQVVAETTRTATPPTPAPEVGGSARPAAWNPFETGQPLPAGPGQPDRAPTGPIPTGGMPVGAAEPSIAGAPQAGSPSAAMGYPGARPGAAGAVPPAAPVWGATPAAPLPGGFPAAGAPVPGAGAWLPPGGVDPRYVPGPGMPGMPGVNRTNYGAMAPVSPRRPVPGRTPRTPWWQREGVISRVLAVAGVGVTLIGVVMLLVLAAQAGFFGPVPRVVAGAAFSGALVAVAARVHGRAGGQVGAIALAATGIAGGYLDVVAVTSFYGWLNPVVGYVVALGIAAGGVALAMRWKSEALAVLVVLGAALLSPAVTTELALLAFLIVLQIAALPVQLVRDWPYLHIVRTVPAALATFVAVVATALDSSTAIERNQVLAAAVAVAVVGLVGTVLVVRRRPTDSTASFTFGAATVPLLAAPTLFQAHTGAIVSGVFAAVLLTVAALPWVPKLGGLVRIPAHLAVVSAVAGACALLETCFGVTTVRTLAIALFLVASGFLAVGGQQRSRVAAALGAAFLVLGGMVFLSNATPAMLADKSTAQAHLSIATALSAIAALATLGAAFRCARRLGLADRESDVAAVAVVAGLAALYALTALTVSLGIATGNPDGFLAGHGIATIAWMATATTALLYGLRRLARTPQSAKVSLAAGLLLTAAALAKLFLFDLATLDGLVRAGAFLVVGVLLLVVGTRYARAFAEAAEAADTQAPSH